MNRHQFLTDISGIPMIEDGARKMLPAHLWIIGCPKAGCNFTASAGSDGRCCRALAAHLIAVHGAQEN